MPYLRYCVPRKNERHSRMIIHTWWRYTTSSTAWNSHQKLFPLQLGANKQQQSIMQKWEGSVIQEASLKVFSSYWKLLRVLLSATKIITTVTSEIQSHFETSCFFSIILHFFRRKHVFFEAFSRSLFSQERIIFSCEDPNLMRLLSFHVSLASASGFQCTQMLKGEVFHFFEQMLQRWASQASLRHVIGCLFQYSRSCRLYKASRVDITSEFYYDKILSQSHGQFKLSSCQHFCRDHSNVENSDMMVQIWKHNL